MVVGECLGLGRSSLKKSIVHHPGIFYVSKKLRTQTVVRREAYLTLQASSTMAVLVLDQSVRFYVDVLGFVLIKRPSSFNFEGAWLFNYGIGIHLLQSNSASLSPSEMRKKINPKDNHISFQSSDMSLVVQKLKQMKIEYVTAVVEEGGIKVDQLFFHDPDGYMIEICNCHNLPVLPLNAKLSSEMNCHGEAENLTIMENLFSMAMMNIFI